MTNNPPAEGIASEPDDILAALGHVSGADVLVEPERAGLACRAAEFLNTTEGDADGRQDRWLAENKDALETSNAFVDARGLPLARYRPF